MTENTSSAIESPKLIKHLTLSIPIIFLLSLVCDLKNTNIWADLIQLASLMDLKKQPSKLLFPESDIFIKERESVVLGSCITTNHFLCETHFIKLCHFDDIKMLQWWLEDIKFLRRNVNLLDKRNWSYRAKYRLPFM